MKIGIIGVGMVGGTLEYGFGRIGQEVVPVDPKRAGTKLADVLDTPLTFICVPTPVGRKGACDTSIVAEVVRDLAMSQYRGVAVIKSTVTPGTTDALVKNYPQLALAFCPEFLRERARFTDFVDQHEVCIIGSYRDQQYELIREAHGPLPRQFVAMRPLEAEFCKYFSNTYNALRIIFANEFYDVCKQAGADYQTVKNAVSKRSTIGGDYLSCSETLRAFGGACLPKDTAAFANFVGSPRSIFQYIVDANNRLLTEESRKREEWLWQRNDGKSSKMVPDLESTKQESKL